MIYLNKRVNHNKTYPFTKIFTLLLTFFFVSCASWHKETFLTADTAFDSRDTLLLTFAGDLMAHNVNWKYKDFDSPLEDIKKLASEADFSFINVETPVDSSKAYSSYPNFNVHEEFADAAINAGFNVFSLSNNHSNDQGLDGIKATKKYFDAKRTTSKETERTVYSSGLKDSSEDSMSYEILEKNGWKILYLAVTELLNRPSYSSYINYVEPSKKSRKNFCTKIQKLREENPCDFFILSFHTAEPEYVLETEDAQKKFYKDLLDNGVDIISANHPHVPKEWYVYFDKEGVPKKMVFLSQGNTLSGQRRWLDFSNVSAPLEYTGDGFITQVRIEKKNGSVCIAWINPVIITTYTPAKKNYETRILDEDFIKNMEETHKKTSSYYSSRKKLMEKIKGKIKNYDN